MRFVDEEILIKITDPAKNNASRFFKAYLEKNEITVQVSKMPIPALSFLVGEPEQLGRPVHTLDLAFNVVAEDRDEAIENFEKMHFIYDLAKPPIRFGSYENWRNKINPETVKYTYSGYNRGSDDASSFVDVNYRFEIKLKALPRIGVSRSTDSYAVMPNNISCTPIYEMGYVQIPYWAGKENQQKLYVGNSMNMIPIGYKVNLNAMIILKYDDAVIDVTDPKIKTNKPGGKAEIIAGEKVRIVSVAIRGNPSPEVAAEFYDRVTKFSADSLGVADFSKLEETQKTSILSQINIIEKAGIITRKDNSFQVVAGKEAELNNQINGIKSAAKLP